jgi:hypothetical protein
MILKRDYLIEEALPVRADVSRKCERTQSARKEEHFLLVIITNPAVRRLICRVVNPVIT